jgi:beta-lactamase superfamily II metal-dependent hydrolase
MKFVILDVGHGLCAYAQDSANGALLVFDCGHKELPEVVRPSTIIPGAGQYGARIERLFISNYDQDHISDLPGLRQSFKIKCFHRNRTLTAQQLRGLKMQSGPITGAMNELLDMHHTYTGPDEALPTPNIDWELFNNPYPAIADANNLSMVTVLNVNGLRILLPGDLEHPGWMMLLNDAGFRSAIARGIDIFVASHHGRENGYCREVFDCIGQVDVVVFSDSPVKCATQEMANVYSQHARGISFNGEMRYVLSTRKDGTLNWSW